MLFNVFCFSVFFFFCLSILSSSTPVCKIWWQSIRKERTKREELDPPPPPLCHYTTGNDAGFYSLWVARAFSGFRYGPSLMAVMPWKRQDKLKENSQKKRKTFELPDLTGQASTIMTESRFRQCLEGGVPFMFKDSRILHQLCSLPQFDPLFIACSHVNMHERHWQHVNRSPSMHQCSLLKINHGHIFFCYFCMLSQNCYHQEMRSQLLTLLFVFICSLT